MDAPEFTLTVNRQQATILFKLIKITIEEAQRQMRCDPAQREIARSVIIECQALRRQIPECYWR